MAHNYRLVPWGSLLGVLGGLVAILLTPVMATVGFCHGLCSSLVDKPWVIRVADPWLRELGWLASAPGEVLYFRYGRLFVLVYLGLVAVLLAFHAYQRALGARNRGLERSYRLLLASLAVSGFGDFLSYGVGVFSELAWRLGFGLEVLSWSGVLVGSVWYGLVTLRLAAVPRWTGGLVALAGLAIPAAFLDRSFVMYMPNAQMLPYSLTWSVLGGYILLRAAEGRMDRSAAPHT